MRVDVWLPMLFVLFSGLIDATHAPTGTRDAARALEAWEGAWEGEMRNHSPNGASDPIPVTLRIARLDDGSIEWRTVYANASIRGLRDYRLIPDAADSTRFVVDEQNGIRLNARLLGGTLVSSFSVGGQFLVSRYTLTGDRLEHEIVFWPTEDPLTTTGEGPAGEQGMPVDSYTPSGIQRTVLRRIRR